MTTAINTAGEKGDAAIGAHLVRDVSLPALVLHREALEHNIRWMQKFVSDSGAELALPPGTDAAVDHDVAAGCLHHEALEVHPLQALWRGIMRVQPFHRDHPAIKQRAEECHKEHHFRYNKPAHPLTE